MKSEGLGLSTSQAEITHISQHGIWLLCDEKEYFLPYEKFPWFKNANISQVHDVKVLSRGHVYWESLDIDLSLSIIAEPEKFSLVSRH